MYWCEICSDYVVACYHASTPKSWNRGSCGNDTNIGIRADGSTKIKEEKEEGFGDCLRVNQGKSVGADSCDTGVNKWRCGQGSVRKGKYAQGKHSTRSWKSPISKFPKKTIPKDFFKKTSWKSSRPVGRPRKPGIQCFKCKEFGHIASICPSKFVSLTPLPIESDYIISDTCGGDWDSIWVVDPNYKMHMTGNKKLFKHFKRHFGLIMDEKIRNYSFVHGVGEVKVPVDGKNKTIPCVAYAPRLKKNVLSLEQLLLQGIETLTASDTCVLKKMFGNRTKGFDIYENKSEVDLEEEYLDKFYENLDIENGHLNEKEKLQEYIEDYYEKEFEVERQKNKEKFGEGTSGTKNVDVEYSKRAKLGLITYLEGMEKNPLESREEMRRKAVSKAQDEEDVIENDTIIESCLDVLDLIILHEEVAEHKKFFKASMKEIVTVFIPCYFGICKEGEMPPTLLNGKPVDLVALYEVVKEYGGFKKVIQDDAWNKVAVQCGFDCDDDYEVKVAYVRYIELVEWYFEFMKTKRESNEDNTHEADASGAKDDEESKAVGEKSNGWIDDSSDDDLVIIVEVTDTNDE